MLVAVLLTALILLGLVAVLLTLLTILLALLILLPLRPLLVPLVPILRVLLVMLALLLLVLSGFVRHFTIPRLLKKIVWKFDVQGILSPQRKTADLAVSSREAQIF